MPASAGAAATGVSQCSASRERLTTIEVSAPSVFVCVIRIDAASHTRCARS